MKPFRRLPLTPRLLPPCPEYAVLLQSAMKEMARPMTHLCVPRTSRSLSPVPHIEVEDPDPKPLNRSASARHSDRRMERTGSIAAANSKFTISLLPALSPSQVLTIKRSWKHINTKGLNIVIRRCFQRLECISPAVSSAFSNSQLMTEGTASVRTVSEHAIYFMNLLDRIINENDNEVDNELRQLGIKHVFLSEMGVGVPELEKFGEIAADAFLKLDGIRQSKETTKAWRMLIASIVDRIRVGFESELRMRKRKGSIFPNAMDHSGVDRRNSMPDSRRNSLTLHADSFDSVTRKFSQM